MTKDELWAKFRGRFLLFIADAWAARKDMPTAQGLIYDVHLIEGKKLFFDILDAANPPPKVVEKPVGKPGVKP